MIVLVEMMVTALDGVLHSSVSERSYTGQVVNAGFSPGPFQFLVPALTPASVGFLPWSVLPCSLEVSCWPGSSAESFGSHSVLLTRKV